MQELELFGLRVARCPLGGLLAAKAQAAGRDVLSCAIPVIPGPRPSSTLPKPSRWAPERLQFLHTAPPRSGSVQVAPESLV
jgi:hypothetical protein